MAEFKKLSDVEVIAEPAESANVLIEENGVIKKAPKTAVGGGAGGNEYDIVLTVNAQAHHTEIMIDQITISQGNMELVRKAVVDGRIPKAKVIFDGGSSVNGHGVYGSITEADASIYLYGGYIYLSCMGFDPSAAGQLVTHSFGFDETGVINVHRSWYLFLNDASDK